MKSITDTLPLGQSSNDRNRRTHVFALSASKLADGLLNPKLVLSWLLHSLGAPAYLIGLLVPVRESLALLPQVFISDRIRAMRTSKKAWTFGAVGQGLAAAGILLSGLTLEGGAAGMAILFCLGLLATFRSICSSSYKPTLGKTVEKQERGSTTGLAGSLASAGIVIFAGFLLFGAGQQKPVVLAAIGVAAVLWLVGGIIFLSLDEPPNRDADPKPPLSTLRQNISLLAEDADLRWFTFTRALLIATALSPPFLITMGESGLEALGFLVFASALAGLVSGAVWGWLSDRSSRLVLAASGGFASVALACSAIVGPDLGKLGLALAIFALMLAHQGVRLGRSTHLVDMANDDNRAAYTATTNTAIGLVLLAGGIYGGLSELIGQRWVIAVFAVQSALAALAALRLKEVQVSDT
ncbi:MFS transporter [Algicella marina]|uniref:MFS transporter n=1 Tax=Algicella marina TaxID=2683284 RepID=A0A6P1T1H0_9RHOB|nr:MFS transporter [Algicella marina]QHQ35660.1 MFS transporter [Algicella marina]